MRFDKKSARAYSLSTLPLVILLGAQVIVIVLFTYFVVFNVMGRDYDSAVLVAGTT